MYILTKLFMNSTTTFVEANQNELRTPLFPSFNNWTLDPGTEASFENWLRKSYQR